MKKHSKKERKHTDGMNERQFGTYVKRALAKKSVKASDTLYEMLESRLDNVVYRMGLANSRLFARQIVSHGHMLVNNRRVTIPSYNLKRGDKISLRPQSQGKGVFAKLDERLKEHNAPNWIKFDKEKKEIEIIGKPDLSKEENLFDLNTVLEFYNR